jgi:hypothetical protein
VSYLDVPRLHFAGKFFADPSTINNDAGNYVVPAATVDALLSAATLSPGDALLWNPRGSHWFFLSGCTVRSCRDDTGALKTAASGASGDALVSGTVESTNLPQIAKLVDLDPELQTASTIFGMQIKVTLSGGSGGFTGTMKSVPMRDLWFGRAGGGMAGAAGVFQSVLTGVTWDTSAHSPVFDKLKAASPGKLSVKLVAYAYDANSGPDVNPPPPPPATFRFGKIVGTIGPVVGTEPDHFVAERLMTEGANGPTTFLDNCWRSGFGPAPFKIDVPRKKLVIDLGNTMPESSPGGPRIYESTGGGKLTPLIKTGPATTTMLRDLDFTRAHYEQTAGIEEMDLSSTEMSALRTNPLSLVHNKPAINTVLTEHPVGRYLDVSHIAFRLNPGETQQVEFFVRHFGVSKSAAQKIGLKILAGSPSNRFTSPVNLAAGTSVTATTGVVGVKFTAGDPGNPRPGLDGQLYKVGFFWGAPSAGDLRGVIFIRVYANHPAVANPKFADVRPILEEYNRLYPSMKARLNLENRADIVSYRSGVSSDADRMKLMLALSEDDPRYMPVTRDLSRGKRKVLLDWLNRGAPA